MFAAILVPDFFLQAALRHEPPSRSQPVALLDGESSSPKIVQANAVAKQFGVTPDLTASQAAARCGHLKIKSRSPALEKSATEILHQTACHFAANIEATAPGVCTLELKGLMFHDAAAKIKWAEKLRATLATFFLEAQIGFAPTPELALLAARSAAPVLLVENLEEFISTLSVGALEPAPEIENVLRLWGIQSVGALVALGKDKIAERLGPESLELFRRLSPDAVRPLKLVSPPERFAEQMEFENEIETIEPLLARLRQFLEQLTRRMETFHVVVGELRLQLGLASDAKLDHVFKIPAPTGDIEILFRTLRTHLETLRSDSPVVFLSLVAMPAKLRGHQFGLFETTLRNPNQLSETLARLTALLGVENVGSPKNLAAHRPDAFEMNAPEFDAVALPPAAPEIENFEPALRRFRPPVSAILEFQDDRPVFIRSPVFNGAIEKISGPFLSSGNWWDENRWAHEEWDAQTADGVCRRIFRSHAGDFVEGVYD